MLRQSAFSSSSGLSAASSRGSCTYTDSNTPLRSEASTLEPLAAGLATAQPSALVTPVVNVLSASAVPEPHALPLVVSWNARSRGAENVAPGPPVREDNALTTTATTGAGSVGADGEEEPLCVPATYSTAADLAPDVANTDAGSSWCLRTVDEATTERSASSLADCSGAPESRTAERLPTQQRPQRRRQHSQQLLPTSLPLLPIPVSTTHTYPQSHQSAGLSRRAAGPSELPPSSHTAASLPRPSSPLMTSSVAGLSADGRRPKPHRRRPSQASSDDITASSMITAPCRVTSGTASQSEVVLATSPSIGRAPVASGSSAGAAGSASVGSPRRYTALGGGGDPRLDAWEIDEEVAQLARSLRSQIAGQPFVLTPPFGASPTAPAAATSRPSSSYSDFSTGSRGGGGGSGQRRTRCSPSHAAPMAAATTTGFGEDLAATTACTATAAIGRGLLALLDSSTSSAQTSMDLSGAARRLTTPQYRLSKSRQLSLSTSQRSPPSAQGSRTRPQCFPSVQPHPGVGGDAVARNDDGVRRDGVDSAAALSHSSDPGQQTPAMCCDARPLGVPPSSSSHLSTVTDAVPLRAARGSWAAAEVVTQTADAEHNQRRSRVAGDAAAPGLCEGFDAGLSDVAELRRRLLTEDFFSSPCRKLRRDGRFPWKLTTSVLLCILLLVHVTWYQLPLACANEAMRLAITKHFMGDDAYFSKDQGDIVSAPTEWMENLYASIERYVQVYYNLTNASSSEMTYRYNNANPTSWCGTGIERTNSVVDGGEGNSMAREGQWWWRRRGPAGWRPSLLWNARAAASPSPFSDPASVAGPCVHSATATAASALGNSEELPPPYIPVSVIAPVLMRVEVDVYSRREGTQHKRVKLSPLKTAAPVRWLSGEAAAENHGGHADESGEEAVADAVNLEHRWLTFSVDADHPLGPFAKHKEAVRLLRLARRQERHRATERTTGDAAGRPAEFEGASATDATALPGSAGGGSWTEVDAALSVVCMPRYDDLSGRYYRPCASTQATTIIGGAAAAAAGMSTHIVPEFSLMDNVRRIQLEVTLRHETDEVDYLISAAAAAASMGGSAAKKVARGANAFSVGNLEIRSASSSTGRLKSAFAASASAVFQWHVVKDITVHPGGLVETQLHVSTRVWPLGLLRNFWTRRLMTVLLGALAVLQIVLELRALQRIAQHKRRLGRERAAFLARQLQYAPIGGGAEHGASKVWTLPTHTASLQPAILSTKTTVYEWGMPVSLPFGRPSRPPQSGRIAGYAKATDSAAARAPANSYPSGVKPSNYGTIESRHDDDDHAGRPGSHSETVLPPSLMLDTSLSIIASQGQSSYSRSRCASQEGAGDASVLPSWPCEEAASFFPLRNSAESHQHGFDSSVGPPTWIPSALRRFLLGRLAQLLGTPTSSQRGSFPNTPVPCTPGHYPRSDDGSDMRASGAPESLPLRFCINSSGTPVSAVASHASFPPPLHAPLTPQLAERIAERSYVDVRTAWRHHLQQSTGAGWHRVAIIAAAFTLSYSALLLAPLLPFAEVAQTGAYYAWTSVLLGVAALMSCVLLLSYLRFFPTFYFPVMASIHVVPKLFLFGMCVSPLFLGFAFFCVIAFGAHSNGHFATLSSACMGLYFTAYGDSLLATRDVASDTPYAVTAFFASLLVVSFVLTFMMIMLNMAMTITQHEWLRLRRRFGAALSTSSVLFAVRSREEAREEAIEAVRANLEVLWLMLGEDEEEERQKTGAAKAPAATPSTSSADAARLSQPATSLDPSRTTTIRESDDDGAAGEEGAGGGGDQKRRLRHRRRCHKQRHAHQIREADDAHSAGSPFHAGHCDRTETFAVDSSYEVSAASTAPPDSR
ncbi:conserved hypothetical protein [Leishmania major strain Friedlin]|uniref:Polycystin cation channel PKD1/PKD2 domain-containing protein n=1 Tax=Leishmania major TaxID=5664 RepID=Q4QIJ6_LEIMA|nr:conserved hypothetical protein [Leishmania major strain Friedlin]CAG9569035.1 hypothetical_protein_-_conserved [Leishmania major strain Friedlin]CAJ07057.2 conserved hypothetical protein [Leishmania major strain Friedlin]|eukprot:XP_001681002.2 conserved hypothetical protein [Leishmania major strain Friedlin]